MQAHRLTLVLSVPFLLLATDPWRDKPVAQWTPDDAKEVLTDSPWARQVVPIVNHSNNSNQRGGRGGGMGRGGIGIQLPGIGGMGGPGMGRGGGGGGPRQRQPQDDDSSDRRGGRGYSDPPTLTLRWQSALPIQEAQLKTKQDDAPSVDEDHYAIAVVGLPRALYTDPEMTEKKLKGKGELKRDGKKLATPTDVRVYERDDQLMVIFFFSRTKEISQKDHDIEFNAHFARFEVREHFDPSRMIFDGKLAL